MSATETEPVSSVGNSPAVLKLKVSPEMVERLKMENESYETQFLHYQPDIHLPDAHNPYDDHTFRSTYSTVFGPEGKHGHGPEHGNHGSLGESHGGDHGATTSEEGTENVSHVHSAASASRLPSNVHSVLKEFDRAWPMSTPIACYWCCHTFKTMPVGIPIRYHSDRFVLQGCFCSLECATAYNFQMSSSANAWDRYHLINVLAKKLGYKCYVRAAPPREALQMFGGSMKISDFRANTEQKKVVLHQFLMVAAQQQMEETFENNPASGTYIEECNHGFSSTHLSKLEQKLKLSHPPRKRGLLDRKMNIRPDPEG